MNVLNALPLPPALKHNIVRRVRDVVQSLAGTSRYRKFVVVGIARTGSTLLINLLNAHSQVFAFGELFRSSDAIGWDVVPYADFESKRLLALYQSDPCAFLAKAMFRRWPRTCKAVGFKLFYYHAREAPYVAVWDYLARDPEILVLHIKRRSILAQYLSLQLAHKTNVWTATRPVESRPEPIRLDGEACRRHFQWVRGLETACDAFFAGHDMTTIYYEDLIAHGDAEMARIQKVLGLRQEKLSAGTVRQQTKPLSQAIANYGELKNTFADTEWADFFTEAVG